jgi:hypothetical protein
MLIMIDDFRTWICAAPLELSALFNLCYKHFVPTELFVVFGELSLKPVLSVTGLDKKGKKYSNISAVLTHPPVSSLTTTAEKGHACYLLLKNLA